MSENYYQRNLDQLYPFSKTPARNVVLDVQLSDQTSSGGSGGSVYSNILLRGTGTEYELQDDRLIDAEIAFLFRDGLKWYLTEDDFTMVDKEFKFYPAGDEDLDIDPGTIVFPPDPFPPLQNNETVDITFVSGGGDVEVTEPVTLAEAREWAKVEVTDDDYLITALISAARGDCEKYVGISFVQRTVIAILNNSLGNIKLPYGPINNITSVKDFDGTDFSDYTVKGVMHKRLCYPITNYVEVTYTAGYFTLPQEFITAIKERFLEMFQLRGDAPPFDKSMAKVLLHQYRSIA